MKNNSRRAAMEMTVGTMVTIVLLVTVLILGLVLVRTIFRSGTDAINDVDSAVQDEIRKLFADEGKTLVIYPSARQITMKAGDDPGGFAFSVRNNDVEERDFTYTVGAEPSFEFSKCGVTFTESRANSWLLTNSGSFPLGPGQDLPLAELVLFAIPETSPPCTIPYRLDIEGAEYPLGTTVFVTIK